MLKDKRWSIRKHDIPTYAIWCHLKSRCQNPNNEKYRIYRARGIKVCERWQEFNNFYDDMISGYKKGLSIDRIDVNGDYCKENCRWATPKTQACNTRYNHLITFNGITKTLSNWAIDKKVSHSFLQRRIKLGWNINDVLNKPSRFATS